MKKQLTSKQKIILSLITDLTHKNGQSPTLEVVREKLNYSSTSSVQRHTDALKKKEYLEDKRGLVISSSTRVEIPLVGNVACGAPLLAIENIEAYVPIDKERISGSPDNYFFLRAVGDSMNMAKVRGKTIDDGDFVLIKKQNTADPGTRVVALIGENATIKRFVPSNDCIRLEPESSNSANKPIYVFEDISIQGIVFDVIKKGGE